MSHEHSHHRCRRNSSHRALLLMLLPGVAFFVCFHFLPMTGLVLAFKDFNLEDGILRSPWSGLDNFRRLIEGNEFLRALRNTVLIGSLRLGLGFFAPLGLALLLNEVRLSWYKRTIQAVTYVPFLFSWIILGGIVRMLFASNGPMNAIIGTFGGGPVQFMTNKGSFIFVLLLSWVWQSTGYGAIIYLSALSGIDPTLYEAAKVDGAGRWQQMLRITLPEMVPTMVVLLFFHLANFLSAGLDQILNLYNPMVYDVADILDTYTLRRMTSLDFSLATTAGLFKSAVAMMLLLCTNALVRRVRTGEHGL